MPAANQYASAQQVSVPTRVIVQGELEIAPPQYWVVVMLDGTVQIVSPGDFAQYYSGPATVGAPGGVVGIDAQSRMVFIGTTMPTANAGALGQNGGVVGYQTVMAVVNNVLQPVKIALYAL